MVRLSSMVGSVLGLIVLGFGLFPSVAVAQPVTFEQVIKPIECTYTTITTGGTPTTTTNCANQPLPVVTTVTVTGMHVHMIGHFVASDTRVLTVWVAGHAYTLGATSSLAAIGDTWTLDLDMVQAGNYAVTLEAETTGNYLLRNMNAATFIIATSVDIATPQSPLSPDVVFGNEPTYGNGHTFYLVPALPGSSDLHTPLTTPVPVPSIDSHPTTGVSGQSHIATELGVAAAVIVPLVGVCVAVFIRGRLPK